jgi:hypothetical protein
MASAMKVCCYSIDNGAKPNNRFLTAEAVRNDIAGQIG